MKTTNILLFYLFFAACLCGTTSCGNDKTTQKKPKTQQKKKKKAKPAKQSTTKSLPPISKLKKTDRNTYGRINSINGMNVDKTQQPIPIKGKKLLIKGVASDRISEDCAAGAYVKIGGRFFQSQYGQPSQQTVKKLKDKKYLKSGFIARIPTTKLKKGVHDVSLFIVAKNRKIYYEQEKIVKIVVK